jgi:hypothetical protein
MTIPQSPAVGAIDLSRIRLTSQTVLTELGRLTGRDQWMLHLLNEHKVFTTEHLAALAFGSLGRTRNRLNTLHQRGVLDRFRHLVRPGSQAWRWTLGPVGAAILAATRDEASPRPNTVREATMRLAASPQLAHRLGVNGFFTALYAHARRRDGIELLRWWSETHARGATGDLVRPDAAGLWREHHQQVPFWLEYDLGTEPLRTRVVAKLDDYANLAGTQWAFPLLFWLPTTLRETNLHTALASTHPAESLTIATAAADYAATHGGPAGRVWQLPGHTGRVRLVDIPTTSPGAGADKPWEG